MAKQRQINIQPPLAGLNRKAAYRSQPPYSSSDLLNVRAVETIAGRERFGSRPGLVKSHLDNLGGPVRLLAPMTLALGDGFTAWSDTFGGLSMAAAWTKAAWAASLPLVLSSIPAATIDTSVAEGEAVLDVLAIDTTKSYTVEVLLVPWNGEWHGRYRLYLRLNDTTPAIATEGVMVELVMTGSTGAYTGTLRSVISGVVTNYVLSPGTIAPQLGWLSATVSGNTITVYWNGVTLLTQVVGAQTWKRVGFGLQCTVDGGLALASVFRVQHYSTGSVNSLRSMLVASAGGDLYRESTYGRMTAVASSLTLRDDAPLSTAQDGQKLYIADYGDVAAKGADGTVSGTSLDATGVSDWTAVGIDADDMVAVISNPQGTAIAGTYKIQTVASGNLTLAATAGSGACAYRIERAPKVYDPLLETIVIMTATIGQVPTGCPLTCRFIDRIVLAGAEIAPHVWYMSRQGDPLDWDYSQEDSQRAVAGTASAAGVPGDPITALATHSDDYLIIACRNSLWRLRGDPAAGGSLDALSHTVGIIGPRAWCLGPDGALIFLSMDGMYALPPGGNSFPAALSREVLPQEFLNLNPDMLTVSLEYDIKGHGVHIYLTPESSNSRIHWWMDWDRKTFWPMSLSADHEPTATCALQAATIEDSGVILGGRDGTLRRMSYLAESDCGTSYTTYVIIGPIALAPDANLGAIVSMDAVMAETSGPVTWELRPSLTFEGASSAVAAATGTWNDGINASDHPYSRGQAFTLKVSGTSSRKWAMENIVATVKQAGQRRIS